MGTYRYLEVELELEAGAYYLRSTNIIYLLYLPLIAPHDLMEKALHARAGGWTKGQNLEVEYARIAIPPAHVYMTWWGS